MFFGTQCSSRCDRVHYFPCFCSIIFTIFLISEDSSFFLICVELLSAYFYTPYGQNVIFLFYV